MKAYRAGIIGCGSIGGRYDERKSDNNVYTHAGMYRTVKGFELICAADVHAGRLDEFNRFWAPVKCYHDYKEMLRNEKLDILSIATPDENHHEIILDAVQYQTPRLIFTEKPLAMSLDMAIEVYKTCQSENISLVVDYIRRWDENHQRVKELLGGGGLGAIQSVTGYYVRGLRHNGCQMINTLQFLFGKIVSVQVMGDDGLGSLTGDPSMDIALKLENGTPAYMLSLDKLGYGFSIFEIDIFGGHGRLRILDGGQRFELFKTDIDPQFPNFKKLMYVDSYLKKSTYGSAMKRGGRQLISFLDGKTGTPDNTAIDAIDDLCVIEAALNSAKNDNRPIHVQRYQN
ncbi:MAG: Gfo/Idh/MocA family oxidoreductase [Syntrophales bacterium]